MADLDGNAPKCEADKAAEGGCVSSRDVDNVVAENLNAARHLESVALPCRTHMTLKERTLKEIDSLEPSREEISSLAKGSQDSDELQLKLKQRWPYWENSPMARHELAKVLFKEGHSEESRAHLDAADRLWVKAEEFGVISSAALQFLRTSIVICRCRLEASMAGDALRDHVGSRREELSKVNVLSDSERLEEYERLDQFLHDYVEVGMALPADFSMI